MAWLRSLRWKTVFAAALGVAGGVGMVALAPASLRAQQPSAPWDIVAQAEAKRKAQGLPVPSAVYLGEGALVHKINNWTVGLAGGLPEGTFLRFAAEIARNLNGTDDLRVLPVVTPGATENVKDLLYLKGIDIAITHADVFEHFRNVEKISNIDRRVHFISEMYISEIHVLARAEIKSFKDLEGKTVGFHTPGAGPSVTAPILFQRMGVKVNPVFVNNAIAIEKMKTGEIAALVHTVGKPNDLFVKVKNDFGFHFLPIPLDKFDDIYVPSTLTSDDYPGYVKPGETVDTIGVQAVLAVFNWPKDSDRYRRVQRFVDFYFDRFSKFQQPPYHPKWRSVNLAAKVPGWTRYVIAEEKLKQISDSKPAVLDPSLARVQAARVAPNDVAEQERLFQQFIEWNRARGKTAQQ
ncbi:MAG: TAXI family TRAP transporter solute-binding subunit [Hyphomicrobiaceae bacterium]|nr:TAXI family TRAP transporter solute-binding subunit [Hyphomicrobiaceae bacterium]